MDFILEYGVTDVETFLTLEETELQKMFPLKSQTGLMARVRRVVKTLQVWTSLYLFSHLIILNA